MGVTPKSVPALRPTGSTLRSSPRRHSDGEYRNSSAGVYSGPPSGPRNSRTRRSPPGTKRGGLPMRHYRGEVRMIVFIASRASPRSCRRSSLATSHVVPRPTIRKCVPAVRSSALLFEHIATRENSLPISHSPRQWRHKCLLVARRNAP